jgi:hypothetical protein
MSTLVAIIEMLKETLDPFTGEQGSLTSGEQGSLSESGVAWLL